MSSLTFKELLVHSRPVLVLFLLLLVSTFFENKSLFLFLNGISGYGPMVWLYLTHMGDTLVAISIFSVFVGKQSRLLWSLAVSMIITTLAIQGLKYIVDAPRPPAVLGFSEISVIVPSSYHLEPPDPDINYEQLIEEREDTRTAWKNIESDPHSPDARYWIPRMGGLITKKQFGIAFMQETQDLAQGTYQHLYRPNARSFPSGHTATIACALTLIMLYFRKRTWSWLLALTALIIGGTRVVVGVHWPIDVAVGGLMGSFAAIVCVHYTGGLISALSLRKTQLIALLPALAAIILLVRTPIYPEIAIFENVVAVSSLAIAFLNLWLTRSNL